MKKLDLGKEKINTLLLSFAIPCVISMLINSVYNIVDQIFIGKGVGTLGNAATNVIFPLVIIANAISGLIGNGASANLSLRLGEKKEDEAKKCIGSAITLTIIVSIVFSIIIYLLLPNLVYLLGCTKNVYHYALDYGRIILIGAPFMITYSAIASIIRADGSPKYSMILLVVGAIINIILDPIFIFTFNMGVKGGAIATVIGQIVSCIMALVYIPKIKSVKLEKSDFKLDKSITRTLGLGLSSFITQATVLALFVFMNNIMTKYGATSKFGSDIPLSVYGVISKINSLYISTILGISIGSQPIIGFNYGAGNYSRVRETLKKVLVINMIVGIIFNTIFFLFPTELAGIFISKTDPSYDLFMEFAVLMCRSFLLVCCLNFLEMTTSIVVQSLGNVKKATAVSFIRQIILFIPIALILCILCKKGIYGALYAGCISDSITFVISIFILLSEYKKLKDDNQDIVVTNENQKADYQGPKIVVTISREYGSGGRYVGKLLADRMHLPFYDKELISLAAKESGLSSTYIIKNDEIMASSKYKDNNDDRLFVAEVKVIKGLAKHSCVIVGRCANYILEQADIDSFDVFIRANIEKRMANVSDRVDLKGDELVKFLQKRDHKRRVYYRFYTKRKWGDYHDYNMMLDSGVIGKENCINLIIKAIGE